MCIRDRIPTHLRNAPPFLETSAFLSLLPFAFAYGGVPHPTRPAPMTHNSNRELTLTCHVLSLTHALHTSVHSMLICRAYHVLVPSPLVRKKREENCVTSSGGGRGASQQVDVRGCSIRVRPPPACLILAWALAFQLALTFRCHAGVPLVPLPGNKLDRTPKHTFE